VKSPRLLSNAFQVRKQFRPTARSFHLWGHALPEWDNREAPVRTEPRPTFRKTSFKKRIDDWDNSELSLTLPTGTDTDHRHSLPPSPAGPLPGANSAPMFQRNQANPNDC
jgi:hypothetical protein